LVASGTWAGDPEVDALLARAADLDAAAGTPVLVHGDLHARHLLVGAAGRATGVVDWGDLCLADPAVDLSLGFAAFSGRAREAFLAAYGPVDAERELRARALAVRLAALLARYASVEGSAALLAESLASLHRAAR
jgi:aminoglycoside phosphotransferase (APT) family kinase protein